MSGGAISGSSGGSTSSEVIVSISLSGIITSPIFLPFTTSPESPVLTKRTINTNSIKATNGAIAKNVYLLVSAIFNLVQLPMKCQKPQRLLHHP